MRCGRDAFTRIASGEALCKEHFSESIEKRVLRTIRKYNIFNKQGTIAVGLSGGKDSVALIHILDRLEKSFSGIHIAAVTINEGIRGYRNGAIAITDKICQDLSIPHHSISFEETFGAPLDEVVHRARLKDLSLSACALCGILRRHALNNLAFSIGANWLATGHNMDDEAQTILINLVKGDERRFMRLKRTPKTPSHPRLVSRVRPLVLIKEREIVLYNLSCDLDFHDYPCPYADVALRNKIRDFLTQQEEKHQGTMRNIIKVHDAILESNLALDRKTEIKTCTLCGFSAESNVCKACQVLQELELTD